jgi:hypothetical protein
LVEEVATAGWSDCSDLDLEQLAAVPRKGSSPRVEEGREATAGNHICRGRERRGR